MSRLFRRSGRLKPRRHERVLSDAIAVPDRTVLPAHFVGAVPTQQLQVVTTDRALYVRVDHRTTRLPWSEIAIFEHVADALGEFVIGELWNGDSFRICVGDGLAVESPDRRRGGSNRTSMTG